MDMTFACLKRVKEMQNHTNCEATSISQWGRESSMLGLKNYVKCHSNLSPHYPSVIDLCTSSSGITWKLVKNAESQAHPDRMHQNLHFNKSPRWCVRVLKHEKYWPKNRDINRHWYFSPMSQTWINTRPLPPGWIKHWANWDDNLNSPWGEFFSLLDVFWSQEGLEPSIEMME